MIKTTAPKYHSKYHVVTRLRHRDQERWPGMTYQRVSTPFFSKEEAAKKLERIKGFLKNSPNFVEIYISFSGNLQSI